MASDSSSRQYSTEAESDIRVHVHTFALTLVHVHTWLHVYDGCRPVVRLFLVTRVGQGDEFIATRELVLKYNEAKVY